MRNIIEWGNIAFETNWIIAFVFWVLCLINYQLKRVRQHKIRNVRLFHGERHSLNFTCKPKQSMQAILFLTKVRQLSECMELNMTMTS